MECIIRDDAGIDTVNAPQILYEEGTGMAKKKGELENNDEWGKYNKKIEYLHRAALKESDSKKVTEECLQWLCQARFAFSREDLVEVERSTSMAEGVLERAQKSKECEDKYGRRIVLYELLWLAVLLILMPVIIWRAGSFEVALIPVEYYLVGGIGGVAAALLGFVRHAADRDMDVQFIYWYYLKPVLGLLVGPVVYLILTCGVLAIGMPIKDANQHLFLLMAWLAGFSERFSLGMLDAIMDTMLNLPGKKKSRPTPTIPYQPLDKR